MTPSELKYHVDQANEESHFFDRKTMKFFGDTMKNYGVRKTVVKTNAGKDIAAYELYRKHPVKHGLKTSAYFDRETFRRIMDIAKDYNA